MRERLTVAFIAITLLVLLGAGAARSYALDGDVRARESDNVRAQAETLAVVLQNVMDTRGKVTQADLERLAVSGTQVTYEPIGSPARTVNGAGFEASDDPVDATVVLPIGTITVSRSADTELGSLWGGNRAATLAVFLLLALVAGIAGYFVARALSAPFRQLAVAAAALGRGRFDLDLPKTRVPEALAIGSALDSSATQLRDRLEREREFGLYTSHVLRTPLTSLRLHLESLVGDPDLTEASRDAALDCLKAVGQLNQVAGELVEISGRGVLLADAAMPLRDLATQVAQRWADVLGHGDRTFTAAVEGDIELMFTPGPVEQVLDTVLEEVAASSPGDVRLVFEGAASRLRIDLSTPTKVSGERIGGVLAALGGRVEPLPDGTGLRLYLPRR